MCVCRVFVCVCMCLCVCVCVCVCVSAILVLPIVCVCVCGVCVCVMWVSPLHMCVCVQLHMHIKGRKCHQHCNVVIANRQWRATAKSGRRKGRGVRGKRSKLPTATCPASSAPTEKRTLRLVAHYQRGSLVKCSIRERLHHWMQTVFRAKFNAYLLIWANLMLWYYVLPHPNRHSEMVPFENIKYCLYMYRKFWKHSPRRICALANWAVRHF